MVELFIDFLIYFFVALISSIIAYLILERVFKRLNKIEHRLDNLEGYFKFNPDGTVSKVSDLDIDCSAVDIDKPTE